MNEFTHLHVHTQYSILDGASNIDDLLSHVKSQGMSALAITDHGNLYGVKEFHNAAQKKGVKPILGCEAYVAPVSRLLKEGKENKSGYHLVLLAKNLEGYHNLLRLISYSWIEGFYYKPRIDKELLRKYSAGLIATSACLGGEIPSTALSEGIDRATELALEYKEIFGDDFYLEITLHPTQAKALKEEVYDRQLKAKELLLEISSRTGIKCIASNDAHFIKAEDAEAHDRLVCLNTNSDLDDPNRMRYTMQEYIKSPDEMYKLFADVPEICRNTMEIAQKVETYDLNISPVMPDFPLPEGFDTEADYLRHITLEGAHMRWGDPVPPEKLERVNFELDTVINMGFPGYFLIVWDFIRAAREMGVWVGPGRGSAAGSAVAYCLQITNIDPIKYDLLFERFLNPDRVSMPDVDIDFDEDGRDKVIRYVADKYGQKRVAHIITFTRMQPKMAIKDVARIQKLDLSESNRLAKLVPEKPGTSFKDAYEQVPELRTEKNNGTPLIKSTLKYAEVLEGSVRGAGIHACGVIIGKNDLEEYIPLSTAKDASLYVTQYEGKHVEDVGMLKMDFLGLKTLSIIKDAVENIKISSGIDIDVENLPLDDAKTFALFGRGETVGLFQFESAGMQKYLRELKPNRFEDLIAMNALYRPGPMEYIPQFVNRKHGREPIRYDLPEMEEFLQDTYGITVYQEQVMLLSRKLAGFTRGEADTLRKGMAKKKQDIMEKMKIKFLEGGTKNGHSDQILNKIWGDWEAFASYAFNKSHSTCYAWLAYQTAWLKAHYPAQFMAAVLSRNLGSIDKITIFMDECRRMNLDVLGPDVNESRLNFNVNTRGQIRFGLGAVKGVGSAASEDIITEREKNGTFVSVYDFVQRVNLHSVNKKNLEALVLSGAFDCFAEVQRHQYFSPDSNTPSLIEHLIRYGSKFQSEKSSSQNTLFGANNAEVSIQKPEIPKIEAWSKAYQLAQEKELVGIYLSAHPLDDFRLVMDAFCNTTAGEMANLDALKGRKEIKLAGMLTKVEHRTTKEGKAFGTFEIEDYTGSFKAFLFSKDYNDYRGFMTEGANLMLTGNVAEREFGGSRKTEFKIQKIEYLDDLKGNLKGITLKLDINELTPAVIGDLEELSAKNKGKASLAFLIWDPESKIWVQMISKSMKVDINPQFVANLRSMQGVSDFRIN